MAQVDTGLGWSAKGEYLKEPSGPIATTGGMHTDLTGFENQPIPDATFPDTIEALDALTIARGLMIGDSPSGDRMYVLANTPDCYIIKRAGTYGNGYTYISPVYRARVYLILVLANGRVWQRSAPTITIAETTTSGDTVYYEKPTFNYNVQNYYIKEYADDTEMMSIIHSFYKSDFTFTKVNTGYAVACLAKWHTQNGTLITSPVLISSSTEYTDMSFDDPSHSIAKLNMLLQGIRFYMAFFDLIDDKSLSGTVPVVDLTDRGNLTLDQVFMTIISTSYAHVIIINSPDPYSEEGAGSGEEGGDGEDLEDDEMGISHHAIPAAINTGFCRIYCPNEQQLRDLSNFLWSAQYDLTAVKKLFANPMDSVLGLSAVPLTLSGANQAVYLGGVDTEMSFPMVSYQSYQVPMGAITVEKRWGSYLDYDPYTKFSIYLPFIGFKDLSADDIMGKQIILDYDVDILSGACTARLQAAGNVLYQWSGQCSIQLPVTASNWNQVFQSATSAALSAGLSLAAGTAGPVLAGALAAEGVQAIMGKPRIERGGTASGAAGWMGGLTPYLVRVTPEAIIPSDQNKFIGYPAFNSISLGSLTGYNEISSIHLEGIPATGAELEELEAILKGGVIF